MRRGGRAGTLIGVVAVAAAVTFGGTALAVTSSDEVKLCATAGRNVIYPGAGVSCKPSETPLRMASADALAALQTQLSDLDGKHAGLAARVSNLEANAAATSESFGHLEEIVGMNGATLDEVQEIVGMNGATLGDLEQIVGMNGATLDEVQEIVGMNGGTVAALLQALAELQTIVDGIVGMNG
jgi:hypothetical protein